VGNLLGKEKKTHGIGGGGGGLLDFAGFGGIRGSEEHPVCSEGEKSNGNKEEGRAATGGL